MSRGSASPPTRRRRSSARRPIPVAPESVLGDVAPDPGFDAWAERVLRRPALRPAKAGEEPSLSEMAIPIPERIARELRISKGSEIVLEFPAPRHPAANRNGPATSAFEESERARGRR